MLRKMFAEFLGTFALVFAGTGAIIVNDVSNGAVTHPGIAITFGLVVMAMIYALGDLSGAHLNPAVSIAFAIDRRMKLPGLTGYIVAQCAGALFASAVLKFLFIDHELLGSTLPSGTWEQSFVLELILTFLLMFVILNVATGAREKGIMAGIAIGGTVGLEAMFAGPICGASMNPARSLAPAVVSGHVEFLWVYLLATTAGAVIAVPTFRILQPREPVATKASNKNSGVAEVAPQPAIVDSV